MIILNGAEISCLSMLYHSSLEERKRLDMSRILDGLGSEDARLLFRIIIGDDEPKTEDEKRVFDMIKAFRQ